MQFLENNIKTMLVNSDAGKRNYEVIRELSGDGIEGTKEAVLVTICPSVSGLGGLKIDNTATHLLNHLGELEINRLGIINLFSTITGSRMSSRGLTVDEDNMTYIEEKMKAKGFQEVLFIIGWGTSMATSEAANLSKRRILEMYKKYCPKNKLYQLTSATMEREKVEAAHPLYLGIKSAKSKWKLTEYIPPEDIMSYEAKKKPKEKKKGEKIEK